MYVKLYHLRKKVNVHIIFVMQSLADIMLTLSKTMTLCKNKHNIVVSDNNIFIQHYSFLRIIMTCRFYILDIPSNLLVSVVGRLNLTVKGGFFFFFFLIVRITTFFIYGSVQKLQFMHDRHRKADGQCLLIGLFFKGIIYQ